MDCTPPDLVAKEWEGEEQNNGLHSPRPNGQGIGRGRWEVGSKWEKVFFSFTELVWEVDACV